LKISDERSTRERMDHHRQLAFFLTEELKQNWSYMRHLEEIRLKHAHIFLIITGAIISAYSFLVGFPTINPPPQQSFESLFNFLINYYGIPIIAGSSFVFVYGFCLCIFLAFQKRGYEHYRIVNAQIRNWFIQKYDDGNQLSFEKKLSGRRTARELVFSTFFFWYLLIVLVNVFAFMVLQLTLLGLIAFSWSVSCKIILSVFASFCIFLIESYTYIRLNREIEMRSG